MSSSGLLDKGIKNCRVSRGKHSQKDRNEFTWYLCDYHTCFQRISIVIQD